MARKPPPRGSSGTYAPSFSGGGMINLPPIPAPQAYVPPPLAGPPRTLKPSPIATPDPVTSTVSYASPPAPAPTPPAPVVLPPAATTYAVKQPSPSLVTYNADTLPQELIIDLLFEDVGGTELINIARHDTINGQNVVYSLVSNLSILNRSFNPNNILAGQISYSQFSQYSLDIASKLVGISLDANGSLVIEFSSIGNDEYAEIELSSDGTIYRIGMVVPT
jgi:hypothetical protein